MRHLVILLLLLTASCASAFGGVTRVDWHGKTVDELGIVHTRASFYIFLQPDCDSCAVQLSNYFSASKSFPGVQLIIVTQKNSEELRDFLSPYPAKYTVFPDLSGATVKKLNLRQIPATLITDAEGIIRGAYEGILSKDEILSIGNALITGKPVPIVSAPGHPGGKASEIPGVTWKGSKNNLLIFHALECQFCKEELPYLVKYARDNPTLMVWIVAPEKLVEVKDQFRKAGAPNNIKFADIGNLQAGAKVFQDYRVSGTPTQILVDGSGDIVWRGSGFNPQNNVFKQIRLR